VFRRKLCCNSVPSLYVEFVHFTRNAACSHVNLRIEFVLFTCNAACAHVNLID